MEIQRILHIAVEMGDLGQTVNTEYVIVTPTYSGVAKYHTQALPLLDVFWPGHPPVIILSDNNNLMTSDVIIKPSANWLGILLNGLISVRKTRPEVGYVFLLLD